MMKQATLLVCLVLLHSVAATIDISFTIQGDSQLSGSQPANFGMPSSAKPISAMLVTVKNEDKSLCSNDNSLKVDKVEERQDGTPVVLLISRGGCNFVKKVANAEAMFSKRAEDNPKENLRLEAVIVTNNVAEPLVRMGDDGSGGSVSTPSYLIKKGDGETLYSALKGQKKVIVNMVAGMEVRDPVELDLFVSVNSPSFSAIAALSEMEQEFGDHLAFSPRADGSRTGPRFVLQDWTWGDAQTDCLLVKDQSSGNNRTFCEKEHGKSGVEEALRQLCLFKTNTAKWWDYSARLVTRGCVKHVEASYWGPLSDKFTACADGALSSVVSGSEADAVKKCRDYTSSEERATAVSKLLQEQVDDVNEEGIIWGPALMMNDILYQTKAAISYESLKDFACSGLSAESSTNLPVCGGVQPAPQDSSDNSGTVTALFVIVVLLAVGGGGVMFWQHKRRKQDIRDIMKEYAPMEG